MDVGDSYAPFGVQEGDGASEEKRVKNTGSSGGPDFRMSDDERLRSGSWALSNNIWTYLDKNGNRVTNEWKKGADNLWRYLNSSGEMAVNNWADNDYYVDSNGIMVVNKWMQLENPYNRNGETCWFILVPAENDKGQLEKDRWQELSFRF